MKQPDTRDEVSYLLTPAHRVARLRMRHERGWLPDLWRAIEEEIAQAETISRRLVETGLYFALEELSRLPELAHTRYAVVDPVDMHAATTGIRPWRSPCLANVSFESPCQSDETDGRH